MNRLRSTYTMPALLLIPFLLAGAGCNQQTSNAAETDIATAGRVAIINLDAIAKALGRDRVILASIQQHNQQAVAKLQNIKAGLNEQIKGLQAEIEESEAGEDNEKLGAMVRNAQQRLKKEVGAAQQNSARIQAELIRKFREEVIPFARRAALNRGMSVVMLKQANILHYDPGTDITNAVIDDMQAQARGGASPPPPASSDAPPDDASAPTNP